ncbi:alpha/beta hydrolase [Marinoscillum sp. MHG1-6]|uniref:alpha/beta hydrolase n=1 Tax=Marinoscillum sp. MHG1-6 TaxID=2959627 RepID=UPI002157D28E|nr:alpha/beta hydrolase [Marinoscillum sp. MHG1-6]
MSSESDYFLGFGGISLHVLHWFGEKPEKILCIVHGHGEHGGRYEALAGELVKENFAVFAMDLRGHGLSSGKKGHAPSHEALMGDIEELLKTAREKYNDLPMYLMGHSMGGNLVANYMTQDNSNELSGFILSSPWLKLAFEPPAIKLALGKMMSNLWPAYSEDNGLDTDMLSRIPEEVQAYNDDPLVHGKISAGLFNIINKGTERVFNQIEKIKKPALIYHGSGDRIIDYHTTEKLAQTNSSLFEWHPLQDVYHEAHHDLGKEMIPRLILDWIKKN